MKINNPVITKEQIWDYINNHYVTGDFMSNVPYSYESIDKYIKALDTVGWTKFNKQDEVKNDVPALLKILTQGQLHALYNALVKCNFKPKPIEEIRN